MAEKPLEPGLYLAPSPIGHLGDLSLRLIKALGQADLVAAEDTRRAVKLLNHLALSKPLISYREQNHQKAWPKIEKVLAAGGLAILLSDAGAPVIADPGAQLVQAARSAGYPVWPLPGPSAVITALMAAGFWAERFIFGGFLPEKPSEREALIRQLDSLGLMMVFFEAPHRLLSSLKDLARILGERSAFLAREMTKIHEEYLGAPLPELLASVLAQPRKGEITLVIAPNENKEPQPEPDWASLLKLVKTEGRPLAQVAAEIAKSLGRPKKEVYAQLLKSLKSDLED
ncbi:MAG: 16S rRNA (cytidine(1402)-2'-O)-methyltransferase [Deltaproteobacteria bacterium]|jgi:16S rRNA (cytidine1402-2'-O)-methyltransferase|nr:16S rRNA (cytidine(1402)-2'-O)-methyltransferase [Deltaproteobacteria bacterium]